MTIESCNQVIVYSFLQSPSNLYDIQLVNNA